MSTTQTQPKLTFAELPWATRFKVVGESQECVKISDDQFAVKDGGIGTWNNSYTISHVKAEGRWSDVSTWKYEDGVWWA